MNVTNILSGRTLLIAGLGLALTASAVHAQDRNPPRERQSRMIQMMDTDEDQKVTIDEIKAEQKRLIAASDLNGDGKLDVKEFSRRGWLFRRPPTTKQTRAGACSRAPTARACSSAATAAKPGRRRPRGSRSPTCSRSSVRTATAK